MLNTQTERLTLEIGDGCAEVIDYLRQRIRFLTSCIEETDNLAKRTIDHTARSELIMIYDMLTGSMWFADEGRALRH